MAKKYKVSIEQLALDLENLELRVSIPNNPFRYAPLGEHIRERLHYLRKHYPDSELIQEYETLYGNWGKVNTTLTGADNKTEILNDKSDDI